MQLLSPAGDPEHHLRPVPLGPGGEGEGPAAGRGVARVTACYHWRGDVSQGLLRGEVRLVDKQKVGDVTASFAPLPLGVPLERVRDCSGDLLPA